MAKSENLPVKAEAQKARHMFVQHYQGDIANLVGKANVNRFIQNFYLAMIRNPDLAVADRKSLFLAVLYAAQRNLEVGVEDGVALLTFKGIVTPVVQYRAYLKKAIEGGALEDIKAVLVHANDRFEWKQGTTPEIVHIPAPLEKDPGEIIGGYVLYRRPGIDKWFCSDPVRLSDIHKVRDASAAWKVGQTGPWKNWYEEMVKKTLIRKAMKVIPAGSKILQLLEDEGRMDTGVSVADILEEEDAITVEATEVSAPKKASALAEQLKQKAEADEARNDANPDPEAPEPEEDAPPPPPEPEGDIPAAAPELEEAPEPGNGPSAGVKAKINELAQMAKDRKVPFEIIAKKYSIKGWVDLAEPAKVKLIDKVKAYLDSIPLAK